MNKDKSPKKGTKIEEEPTEQTEVEDIKYPQLNILSVTKNAQSQNGLKHGDYKRYRHYCTKRLKRIRKGIKFTHGKNSSRRKFLWKISMTSRIPESYNFLYITQKEPGHML
jgi:signal recognition particle subunit SRP68